MGKNLISRLKNGFYAGLAAGALGLGIYGCPDRNPGEPPLNKMPIANAIAEPIQGYSPLAVNFDGTKSYDPDGSIKKYIWNFGNGIIDSTSGATAKYIYELPGNYAPGLTVEDNSGARSSRSLENITVSQLPPPPPPQKDQIAFMRFVEFDENTGSQDIYSMNIDGTGLKRLTCSTNNVQKSLEICGDTLTGQNITPTYSPDGSQIVFASNRSKDAMALWIMNYDGSNPTRLTFNGLEYASEPVWCNNGKIYFNFWDENSNTQGTARINPNRTEFQKIIEEPFHNWLSGRPACSPDGSQIAFVTDRDGNPEIYTSDSIGSLGSQRNRTNNPAADALPAWSPDGIIFFESHRFGSADIYRMNSNGSNVIRITNDSGVETDPAVSSDGSKIVFAHDLVSFFNHQVYMMNADGTGWTQLTFDGANRYPAWKPR